MVDYKKLVQKVDERIFKRDGITSKSDQQFLKFDLLLGIMIPGAARFLDCIIRNKLEGYEQAEKDRIKIDTIYFKCTTTLPSQIDFDQYTADIMLITSKYNIDYSPELEKKIIL